MGDKQASIRVGGWDEDSEADVDVRVTDQEIADALAVLAQTDEYSVLDNITGEWVA